MKDVRTTIPSLLVAKKTPRQLYIVLDPNRVKDTWEISTPQADATINDFGTFVKVHLADALRELFADVKVVSSSDRLPKTPHIVCDVKVDRVQLQPTQVSLMRYTFIEMTWSFALRASEADEYTFSFAGTAQSRESYRNFREGVGQMLENGITAMLKRLVEGDAMSTLRALPRTLDAPKPSEPQDPPPNEGDPPEEKQNDHALGTSRRTG